MLIIVDGPDCVGKSTFVERLRDTLTRRRPPTALDAKVDVLHKGPPTLHPLDEYEVPLLSYRAGNELHVVCDRWHLGELVYPEVFGRASRMDEPTFRHIELLLAARGAVLVVLDAPVEQVQACVESRGDNLVTRDQVGEIRERFLDATARTTLPLIHLESSDARSEDALYYVLAEAETRATACHSLADYVTYVGPRWPTRLLLGDVRLSFDPDDGRPAFMPYGATSGHYLLHALGDDARFVGIANACDVDNAEHLAANLGMPPITALGVNAHRATLTWRNGRADAYAPHPQYVRRFHHGRSDDYRKAVLGVESWRS